MRAYIVQDGEKNILAVFGTRESYVRWALQRGARDEAQALSEEPVNWRFGTWTCMNLGLRGIGVLSDPKPAVEAA